MLAIRGIDDPEKRPVCTYDLAKQGILDGEVVIRRDYIDCDDFTDSTIK